LVYKSVVLQATVIRGFALADFSAPYNAAIIPASIIAKNLNLQPVEPQLALQF